MIPEWNAEGLLPPINDLNPVDMNRSPYETDLVQLIQRFATSIERCQILRGYLAHRAELHLLGVDTGFQWLDGSFSENIELIEHRSPGDVDVVTFTHRGDDFFDALTEDQIRLLGDTEWIKDRFKVDFYIQSLQDDPEILVSMSAYWYSMWSHRRSRQWKGFLKLDLAPHQDTEALAMLEARQQELANEQE